MSYVILDKFALSVAASLSIVGSLAVVVTILVFKEMYKKKFMKLLLYVSFCDLIGNLVACWGFQPNTTILCPIQAIIRISMYRASWIWTTILAIQLYYIVINGRFVFTLLQLHVFVWFTTITLILIPLSTNRYGQDDEISGKAWCSLMGEKTSAGIWLAMISELPLFLCLLISSILTISIYVHFRNIDMKDFPQIRNALSSLIWYPIAQVICWAPQTITAPLTNFNVLPYSDTVFFLIVITESLSGLYGLFLAVVFFTRSKEARSRWYQVYISTYKKIHKIKSSLSTIKPTNLDEDFDESQLDTRFGVSITSLSSANISMISFYSTSDANINNSQRLSIATNQLSISNPINGARDSDIYLVPGI